MGVNLKFKFTKVLLVWIIILVACLKIHALIPSVSEFGHYEDKIWISIDGNEMTLQQAINAGLLIDLPRTIQAYSQQIPNPGHGADKIQVSVDGVERTLQNSIGIENGLCGSSSNPYTENINFGHYASDIGITVEENEMTLQQAIDSGKFCCVWSEWSECSELCGTGTKTRTKCSETETQPCKIQDCERECLYGAPSYYWFTFTAVYTTIVWDGEFILYEGMQGISSYEKGGYLYERGAWQTGGPGSLQFFTVCRTYL